MEEIGLSPNPHEQGEVDVPDFAPITPVDPLRLNDEDLYQKLKVCWLMF